MDAEDIAQEAMIAGLEGLSAGARPDRLTHWLLGIARHLSFRRKRQESDPALEHVVDPKRRSARSMAIRREMDSRGYKYVEGGPADLLINFNANSQENVDVRTTPGSSYGYGYGYYGYRGGMYGAAAFPPEVETVR